ncbi:hypothetical protein BS17DRAFT_510580 [Gyrodon lividus]|nr:hypothetical protein BS17DRAFT_510580 [Gyrodon lividus]
MPSYLAVPAISQTLNVMPTSELAGTSTATQLFISISFLNVGIRGPARDEVTILSGKDHYVLKQEPISRLSWSSHNAPLLVDVSKLLTRTSCACTPFTRFWIARGAYYVVKEVYPLHQDEKKMSIWVQIILISSSKDHLPLTMECCKVLLHTRSMWTCGSN